MLRRILFPIILCLLCGVADAQVTVPQNVLETRFDDIEKTLASATNVLQTFDAVIDRLNQLDATGRISDTGDKADFAAAANLDIAKLLADLPNGPIFKTLFTSIFQDAQKQPTVASPKAANAMAIAMLRALRDMEQIRRTGTDGQTLSADDDKLVGSVRQIIRLGAADVTQNNISGIVQVQLRNTREQKVICSIFANTGESLSRDPNVGAPAPVEEGAPLPHKPILLPGADFEKHKRCKGFIEVIQKLENKFDPELNIIAYRETFNSLSDPVIKTTLDLDAQNGWANGRAIVFDLMMQRSQQQDGTYSTKEMRRLINGPVRRALEIEVVRIEGLLAVLGPLPSNRTGAAGGTQSRGRSEGKSGPCCLDFFIKKPNR